MRGMLGGYYRFPFTHTIPAMRFSHLAFVTLVATCMLGCGRKSVDGATGSQDASTAQEVSPKVDREPPAPSESSRGSFSVEQIRLAERHIDAGEFAAAEKVLRRLLLVDPDNAAAKFDLAAVEYSKGRIKKAIELLDEVPSKHPALAIPARGRAADLCVEAEQFDDAIFRYRELLKLLPNSSLPHRNLASLLNRQGRRHEAGEHLRELCKLGDVRQDELHALMVLSDAIYDDPNQKTSLEANEMRYFPIGDSGIARKLFSDEKYPAAAELLRESVLSRKAAPSVVALYGRCLAEAQDDQRFSEWLKMADEPVRQHAEYWSAVGSWLANQQRFEEAVRALAEAVLRDPTDVRSYRRMHQALVALEKEDEAKKWEDQHQLLRQVTLASNQVGEQSPPDLELLTTIVKGLEELGRPLEAVLWQAVANHYYPHPKEEPNKLNERRKSLLGSDTAFPSKEERLCGLVLEAYPLPDMRSIAVSRATETDFEAPIDNAPIAVFEDVAEEVGITHAYQVASKPQMSGFTIYQVMGGGVAVVDYDLDGKCDLYFTQGGSDPPDFTSQMSDMLYRNTSSGRAGNSLRLSDTTSVANVRDQQYSTGVAAGDWNQDGFPDLVVGNLGTNRLLINCGDGTFLVQPTDALNDVTLVTSSMAFADVTGDGLPDIYEQNYVHDKNYAVKPSINAKGQLEIVSPFGYQPAMDRLFVNDGSGGRIVKPIGTTEADKSTGLGIVIGRFDESGRNEIYVGNDVRPNQRWALNKEGVWEDIAPITGVALGHDGTRTSSMGIAAGDFDRSGTLDLHITNFESAPARLFVNRKGAFQDRAIAFNLAEDSYGVLGFGTQAIDYDNDGLQDLVVTNGHVENTNIPGSPFEQPPQLFVNVGNRFELMDLDERSQYFQQLHVGRALARLDFNCDGKSDFVVTHLGTRSALVLNHTSAPNHWLDVQLVGVDCERDAIGAKIELFAGDKQWTNWLLAGDGYLCRNEPVVSFGLGKATKLDRMKITWPDGMVQLFDDVAVDQRLLVIQHQDDLFRTAFGSNLE